MPSPWGLKVIENVDESIKGLIIIRNGQKKTVNRKICEKRLVRIMISGKILLDDA